MPAVPVLLALVACGRPPEDAPAGAARGGYDAQGRRQSEEAAPSSLPNILLVVIDTLRADALRPHGAGDDAMPYLASLAHEGTSFADATAAAPWTLPSLASLLTGLSPNVHQCVENAGPVELAARFTTFAEALRSGYGYETAACVGFPPFAERSTLFQGFSNVATEWSLQGTAAVVGAWAARRDPSRPFFLLLHTYDAHAPYGESNHPWPRPPPSAAFEEGDPLPRGGADLESWDVVRRCTLNWRAYQALGSPRYESGTGERVLRYLWSGFRAEPRSALAFELRDEYRRGTRWVDGLLRRSMESLESLGLLENTVVIVTADHGEAFGEHGFLLHGRHLHDELVHVPLVVTGAKPFLGGRVVHGSLGLVDVLPTIFEQAGLTPMTGIEGRSALGLVLGGGEGRPVLSEEHVLPTGTGGEADQRMVSVRSARWKYVATYDLLQGTVSEEAYDLQSDPGEHVDLVRVAGSVGAIGCDAAFCDAVEEARDRLWAAAGDAARRATRDVGSAAKAREAPARPPRVCPPAAIAIR